MHPSRHFLAVLPPLTLQKVETRKKEILDLRVQRCFWGEGRGWGTCELENSQETGKVTQDILTMIVDVNIYSPRIYSAGNTSRKSRKFVVLLLIVRQTGLRFFFNQSESERL